MRILIIHNYYRQPGGEFSVVKNQQELLKQSGHEIILYERHSSEIDRYTLKDKLALADNAINNPGTRKDISALATAHKPDVAHVHNVFPLISPSVYWALKDCGVPIVQTIHNYRFMCPNGLFFTHGAICERCKFGRTASAVRFRCFRNNYLFSAIYALAIGLHRRRKTFNLIDHFIALTEFSAKKLVESGIAKSQKLSVLGNYCTNAKTGAGKNRENRKYFLTLSRLSPEKGIDTAIRAFSDLPDLQLKIAGSGPEYTRLMDLRDSYDISNIEFLGQVPRENLNTLIEGALAVIVPSLCYENFPLAALKSYQSEKPVIGPDHGAFPEIIQNRQTGLLFKPGDYTDLRRKVEWVDNHQSKSWTMGKRGAEYAATQFSPERHLTELERIYMEVTR